MGRINRLNVISLCLLLMGSACGESRETEKPAKHREKGLRIVLLGDSITRRTNWNARIDGHEVFNVGVDGDTTGGFLRRLSRVIDLQPDICFLMGGINDLARGTPVASIFANHREILKRLRKKGIRPVMQSTISVSGEDPGLRPLNTAVDELNRLLRDFCRKEGIDFLDINRHVSSGKGLKPEHTVDGVHLSAAAYELWEKRLRAYLATVR